MVAEYRQCFGFPDGSCSVMKSGKLDKATKEELAVIEELPVEMQKKFLDKTLGKRIKRYEAGFMGDLCHSCSEKKGMSKRKKKIMKLRQRQDEHELSILKILMSELTVERKKEYLFSKMDGKGRIISNSLEEQTQDKLFLDRLFTIIRNNTKLEDLPEVRHETRLLLREVEWEEDLTKVWWNVTTIKDKAEAGWREGFTEAGEGEGEYIEDLPENPGWFIESPVPETFRDKDGNPCFKSTGNKVPDEELGAIKGYKEIKVEIPKTNPGQIQKFLAKLEGVRCEKCERNTYNSSENICENTACPGQMVDEYGDLAPSTNIKNQGVNVIRKRAKLNSNSHKVERITDQNPDADEPIQIRVAEIDERTGKKINEMQNIVWRVTREGVNRVALYECFVNLEMGGDE